MSDFGRAAKNVQKLKDNLKKAGESGLQVGMEGLEENIKAQLVKEDSVASGNLYDSIEAQRSPSTAAGAFTSWRIVGAPYWKYLEFGTGIYTGRGYKASDPAAPYHEILEWVKAKGIQGDDQTQEQIAHAIARSLTTGQQAHKFVRPAWRNSRGKDFVINSVKRSMETAISLSI